MRQYKNRIPNLFILILILVGLLFGACGDEPARGDKSQYIQDAINAVNGGTPLPMPTVDPTVVVNLQLFILNGDKFYTRQVSPVPKVDLRVLNIGRTTVFISSCEGAVLQRKENNAWINIASVRPCGTKPAPLPMNPGLDYNLSFEFLKAAVYPNQNFYVDGTYRLAVPYSLACPGSMDDYSKCIDRHWQPSTEFELRQLPERS
jgi:hypothetical protein